MTTPPVMTLTDELLEELEEAFMLGWNESGEGWNAEYPQTDEAAEMVMLAAKRRAMDSALIARVRDLEAREVELPNPPTAQRSDEEATFSAGACDMLRKCRASIEKAGVRIKQ